MMKKTIVIADLHNNIDWIEPFLENNKHDFVIFLGDYFDSYNDDSNITEKTALWLKQSFQKENRKHLFGNHDISYFCNLYKCPGFTENKNKIINSIISKKEFAEKLDLVYFEQNHVLSHAGFTYNQFAYNPELKNNRYSIENYIAKQCDDALNCLFKNNYHRLFEVGYGRGYPTSHVGGCLWLDWDKEFHCIDNINQIVGHSHGNYIRIKQNLLSKNYCIDCFCNYVGILENNEFTYIPTK
jgi:hypothetical protein